MEEFARAVIARCAPTPKSPPFGTSPEQWAPNMSDLNPFNRAEYRSTRTLMEAKRSLEKHPTHLTPA